MTRLSVPLAWVLGVFFPCIETLRRWNQWGNPRDLPFILDDFVMGGLLIAGAVAIRRRTRCARTLLAAAWGFASAMMYGSFFGQISELGEPDPSGFPAECVVLVKGVLFLLCVLGLVGSLRAPAGEV